MRVKIIFLIIFTSLICKGQDTLIYHTLTDVEQIQNECDSNLFECQEFVKSLVDIMQNPEFYGDTEITIYDSTEKIELKKKGSDLWYNIYRGSNRYEFWITNDILQVWLGDSIGARLILQYDLK